MMIKTMRSVVILAAACGSLTALGEETPTRNIDVKVGGDTKAELTGSGNAMRGTHALEEVIVTAQKRQERALDVPISISAISGERLEKAGLDNAQDLSFAVPTMSVQELSPGRQNITLRGVASTKGSSSMVGVYLDEMSLAGLQDGFVSTYIDVRMTDLERVEVLKGPQGTLFGEGSMGGTVRFMTRDPQLDKVDGRISASLYGNSGGSGLSGEATGLLNLPIVEDKFGLRLVTTYEETGGWIDKLETANGPVLEKDFNDGQLMNFRLKGLWKPSEKMDLKALAIVNRSEGDGTNIVNVGRREDSDFVIELEPTAPTGYTDDYELYNLTMTYDLGFAELLSSTSDINMESVASLHQRRPIVSIATGDIVAFQEILTRDYARDVTSFAQELRLSSRSGGALKWTLGGYYKDNKVARQYLSGFDFARFGQVLLRGGDIAQRFTYESKSWAAFADAAYDLNSRWQLGAGVRYFEDDQKTYNAIAADVSSTELSDRFDATTYRGYLSYGIAQDVRVYGSVSTGFRSGGFNAVVVAQDNGPYSFGPEDVTSYELGTKMKLADDRLSIEAAIFYSKYSDIQVSSFYIRPNGTPQGIIDNGGEAEVKGFEAALSWAATERLFLTLSGDITDTEMTKVAALPPPQVTPVNVGDPIDSVPEYSLSAGVEYGFNWVGAVPGYARVQYNEQGIMWLTSRSAPIGTTGTMLIPQESNTVLNFLNASVGADWSGWGFEIFARNLLDETGALRPGNGMTPQARPRTVGLRVEKSF